ncbi:ethylene-responsive transcription factor RAP2-9 [Iris pallida]|uniref:Ethylene-responsive transcription factor RAP2-9 n=1 Tax=Iris pallida TaxID=29817 RepID=A0AAX6DSR0_IRIPA|nr:ethylene-responsive transcription factor RAP2-9 [Iris pallida]
MQQLLLLVLIIIQEYIYGGVEREREREREEEEEEVDGDGGSLLAHHLQQHQQRGNEKEVDFLLVGSGEREGVQRGEDEEVGEVGGRDTRAQEEEQDLARLLLDPRRRRQGLRHRRLPPARPLREAQLPGRDLAGGGPTRVPVRRVYQEEGHRGRGQDRRAPDGPGGHDAVDQPEAAAAAEAGPQPAPGPRQLGRRRVRDRSRSSLI